MLKIFTKATIPNYFMVGDKDDYLEFVKKQNSLKLGEYAYENSLIEVSTESDERLNSIEITSRLNILTKEDIRLLKEIERISFYANEDIYKNVRKILMGK